MWAPFFLTGAEMLACVVLRIGASGLEVVARRNDKLRKVLVTWHQKEISDVPPANWLEVVTAELDNQDSNRFVGDAAFGLPTM